MKRPAPTDDPRTVAEEVRTTRKARGWTQEHLAEQAGVSLRTIRNIEAGHGARPAMLGAIYTALFGEPETPTYPDEVAAVVQMVGHRLMALEPEPRAELAAQLVRVIMGMPPGGPNGTPPAP